jgi:hypothetical protein
MYCGHKLRHDPHETIDKMQTMPFLGSVADGEDDIPLHSEVPKSVGGYRLLRKIGEGGMGSVYEAEAPGGGSRVAVKLLSPRMASSQISVERFKQEGRLASQLAHPRCVFVLAADTDAGVPYIVMELMPGQTLKDVVESRGPLSPDEAIHRILDVIDGLAEAHRVGMIHRDVKPSNCFVTADNRVKVGDFGLSKSLTDSRDRHLTQSGTFLGTVLFASPEQIRGEPLDYGSDVYSVCATLYYLLCGHAPYHHESLTAALAKAISEDPPPLREKQPAVSFRLEQVVMKGLERARDHRWQTLDDLREALLNLLPSRRHPARPRSLVTAYILDRIALGFLIVPTEIAFQQVGSSVSGSHIDMVQVRWIAIPILLLYFTLCEGLFGTTPGKWLLGLRIGRVGQTVPPGIWRAFLRTTIFHLLLYGVFLAPEDLVRSLGPAVGGVASGAVFLTSAAVLLIQLRKKGSYRGLHDLASGCQTTQSLLPARKLRLVIQQPTPLDMLLPPGGDPLPESLGGYAVRGRLAAEASGEQVWIGQDRVLSRRVLIWLRPAGSGDANVPEASRPARLRRLGSGTVSWCGHELDWVAFAAPLGGPLIATIDPRHPLPWADARFLLDQLVEELRAAEADGTMPPQLGIDQVWVEPNGRLQLLECPLSTEKHTGAKSSLTLVREVATLALEGVPRATAGMVRAPVPPHAAPLLERLFQEHGYTSLVELQRDLSDTYAHRPEVTPAIRAAHLGMEAALLGWALIIIYLVTFGMGTFLTLTTTAQVDHLNAALEAVHDPQKRAKLAENSALEGPLRNPHLVARLTALRDRRQAEADLRRSMLFTPQRLVLEQIEEHAPTTMDREAGYPIQVREAVQWAGAPENTPRGKSSSPWSFATPQLVLLLVIPLCLVVVAGVLRGGLSFLLAGIALMRMDGWRATRRQCAIRAALVWFPVLGLLLGAAAIQAFAPEKALLAAGLWLLAVAILPLYIVIALRFPVRPPQERLLGTCLVPL